MSQTGIVVITHNSAEEVGPCIKAAVNTGARVLVVDNCSTDGTLDVIRQMGVELIANTRNLGFAAAANQGIRTLDVDFVLLLNPDAVLLTPIGKLSELCALDGVAGVGGHLVDRLERPQTGFMVRRLPTATALMFELLLLNRLWPGNPVNWNYRCLGMDLTSTQDVEQPAGALLMLRKDVWHEMGGFDERFYPLWFEDVDFCKRARERGYRFRYEPCVVAKHTGGHSIPKISVEKRTLYWYGSLLRYTAKHFSMLSFRVVSLAVIAGSFVRMVMGIVHERSTKPTVAYGRVIKLAGRCLFRTRGSAAALCFPEN